MHQLDFRISQGAEGAALSPTIAPQLRRTSRKSRWPSLTRLAIQPTSKQPLCNSETGSTAKRSLSNLLSRHTEKSNNLGLHIKKLDLFNAADRVTLFLQDQLQERNCEPQPMLQKELKTERKKTIQITRSRFRERKSKSAMGWLQPHLKFGVVEGTHKVYEERMESYLRLLKMMNCIYMRQLPALGKDSQTRFKAYVGSGNNSSLIKHLIQRRFWWQLQNKLQKEINFLWTQLRKNEYFKLQRKGSKPCIKESCPDKDFILPKNQSKLMTIDQYRAYSKRVQYPEHAANSQTRVHNHFPFNFLIGNKKNLYYNLKEYLSRKNKPIFHYLPLTYHIRHGTKDFQFQAFLSQFEAHKGRLWIIKPGEVTNQGNGIRVVKQLAQIQKLVNSRQKHRNGQRKTHIVQLYLDRPLLFHNRKFDLRHYMLFTSIHGLRRAYWHQEGYVRTASLNFSNSDFNPFIHLTNDAVQKHGESYGKYEPANKLSYMQLNNYIKEQGGQFMGHIIPRMRAIAYDIAMSSLSNLDPHRLQHNFQIFGLDFMIDQDFKPFLIQVNTNPCLQIVCPLLSRIIPNMLDQALRLSLDVVFPPPGHFPNTQKHQAPSCQLGGLRWWLLCEEGEQFRVARRQEQQEQQFSSQDES